MSKHALGTLTRGSQVGNYGVPDRKKMLDGLPQYFESNKIHVSGLIVADYSEYHSHWEADSSLSAWLKEEGIPAISGVDTRCRL